MTHSGDVLLLSNTYVVFASLVVFGRTNGFAGLPNIYGSRAARQGKMHITTSVYYTVYYCVYELLLLLLLYIRRTLFSLQARI